MALLKVICWALIFIIRIRFPPGKSLATILIQTRFLKKYFQVRKQTVGKQTVGKFALNFKLTHGY